MIKIELAEEQRQLVVLALAELALSRPGWNEALREIAQKFGPPEMFETLKKINADRVTTSHEPFWPK